MSFVPYRRGGMGQAPNINPTTIWTPQTGFLNQTGTLTAGYQNQPQVTSVYDVPGLLLPAPACTQASGGAFVSSECVDQALATEQLNFQRTADYNAGLLKLPAPPVPPPAPPPPQNYVAPVPKTGTVSRTAPPGATDYTPPPGQPLPTGDGSATNYVAPETSFFAEDIPGTSFPIWGVAAAGIAALLLFGGRH